MCWNDAHNNIRVIGLHTDIFRGGRIDICLDGSRIRAVCADGWDEHAAMVACRQLFPGSGTHYTHYLGKIVTVANKLRLCSSIMQQLLLWE